MYSTARASGRSSRSMQISEAGCSSPDPVRRRLLLDLRKRRERLLLGIRMVEDHDQLGHDEKILQALAEPAELDLTAATLVVRVTAHERADGDRVQRFALGHVEHEHRVARGRLVHDRLLEFFGLAIAVEAPLGRQNRDAADLLALD